MNYKKYSLENLENWLYDAMSCGEATPQEIYDVIVNVVKDEYYTYKKRASESYELLTLLNNNPFSEEVKAMGELWDSVSNEEEKCREYNLREAEYYDKRTKLDMNSSYDDMIAAGYTMTADGFWLPPQKEDKVVKWQLPVQVDGLTGDCFVEFPDDLLERAGLKEGDTVNWIDNKDGSYTLTKVTKNIKMDEC